MQRNARYMRRNHGTEAPSNLIFVDTESYQHASGGTDKTVSHSLRMWTARRIRLEAGIPTRRVVASGTDAASWWTFLDRYSDAHRSTWVFAHGLGFDLTVLGFLQKLEDGYFTLKPLYKKGKRDRPTQEPSWTGRFIVDGPVTIIKCRTADKRYVFVDTLNYWPLPLKALGEATGTPKMDMPDQSATDSEWLRYCHRDTEIVERAVCDLITKWTRENCGVFKPTAAGLAFTNWLHTCPVLTPDGKCVDVLGNQVKSRMQVERAAYYGGRIQPFRVGHYHGPFYHVDVNSLYPYVMRNHSYPRRYVRDGYRVSPDTLRNEAKVYGVVAEVFINSRHDTYPVRIDGRQYHCNGCFWTTLCGPELSRALDSDHVVRTGRVQYYSVAPIFRQWVDYWYKRKQQADRRGDAGRSDREFAKLCLNSLSGKFAQRGHRWEDVPEYTAFRRWGAWPQQLGGSNCPLRKVARPNSDRVEERSSGVSDWVNCRGIAGHTQVEITDQEPAHAFPAISAFITAHAREHVRRIIEAVGPENVYYLAVDGLIINQTAFDTLDDLGLLHPDELGSWKATGPYSSITINGANDYVLDAKRVVAGWKAKAKKRDGVGQVLPVWERLQSKICKGPSNTVIVREMPVADYRPDRKGRLSADGLWAPYRLSCDPEFGDRPPPGGYLTDQLDRVSPGWDCK